MKIPSGTADDLWGFALFLDVCTGSTDKACEAHGFLITQLPMSLRTHSVPWYPIFFHRPLITPSFLYFSGPSPFLIRYFYSWFFFLIWLFKMRDCPQPACLFSGNVSGISHNRPLKGYGCPLCWFGVHLPVTLPRVLLLEQHKGSN